MAIPWPPELVKCVQRSSFAQTEDPDIKIRTSMATGPKKVRSRYFKGIPQYSIGLIFSRDEHEIFLNFYRNTLSNGELPFEFENPVNLRLEHFRMITPPQTAFVGANDLGVSMTWEGMPETVLP